MGNSEVALLKSGFGEEPNYISINSSTPVASE